MHGWSQRERELPDDVRRVMRGVGAVQSIERERDSPCHARDKRGYAQLREARALLGVLVASFLRRPRRARIAVDGGGGRIGAIATVLGAAAIGFTLMACYGGPPACTDGPCKAPTRRRVGGRRRRSMATRRLQRPTEAVKVVTKW